MSAKIVSASHGVLAPVTMPFVVNGNMYADPAGLVSTTPFRDVFISTDLIFMDLRYLVTSVELGTHLLPFASSDMSLHHLRSKPATSEYSEARDNQVYGSTLHGIVSGLSLLSGTPVHSRRPSFSKEKLTTHYNWSGRGSYAPATPTRDGSTSGQLHLWHDSSTYVNNVWHYGYSRQNAATEGGAVSWEVAGMYSLNSLLSVLRATGVLQRGQTGNSQIFGEITDFSEDSEGLEFTCEMYVYLSHTDTTYTWKYTMSVDYSKIWDTMVPEHPSTWPPSTWWKYDYLPYVKFHYVTCSRPYDTTIPTSRDLMSQPTTLMFMYNYTFTNVGAAHTALASRARKEVRTVSGKFFHELDQSYGDLVSSSSFSTSEAVKSIEGGVSDNLLQTFVKLPAIHSALPKVRESIAILSSVARKDLSTKTLKQILDVLSTTQLQASFQWRPQAEFLREHLLTWRGLINLGESRKKAVVGYGKYKYSFLPGELSRISTLTTRTKIVLDESPRGILAAALGVDAFGVLPKPSNLWDVVPFTFVVNWVTGVGESIRRLEYTSIMLGIPAYYVHTYAVQSEFTALELQNWSIASLKPQALTMKWYRRDVSVFSPLPRNSRFGFGLPTSSPPLGVVLALLYQLFFR